MGTSLPIAVPWFRVFPGGTAQAHDALAEDPSSTPAQFPLVCKAVEACHTQEAHTIAVVSSLDDLRSLSWQYPVM